MSGARWQMPVLLKLQRRTFLFALRATHFFSGLYTKRITPSVMQREAGYERWK